MKVLAIGRVVLVFALSVGSAPALAETRIEEESVAHEIDPGSAMLRHVVAASPEFAVPAASPAATTFSPATLSLSRQPLSGDPAKLALTLGEQDAEETDKSGTDPTKLLASFGFRNDYRRLTDDNSYNVTTFQYGSPLGRPDMSMRLRVPLVATDVLGDGDVGLGDIALRYNWRAYLDKSQGLLLGAELAADTASKDVLGRGKWTIAPSITYAMFLSKNVIFAPAFQQTVSFAGDGNRADINESAIDLYMVFRADDAKSWLVVDPTLGIDWENEQNTPFTLEVEYGRNIGTLFGGALNAFVRPGVGVGQDRPYDWSVEFGFTVVGF